MLEIKVKVDGVYKVLDIFGGEGVDLTIPTFPSNKIDDAILEYSESFEIPRTERNMSLLGSDTKEFDGKISSGGETVDMVISVQSELSYTPSESYSIQAVSKIKSIVEKMKKTKFGDVFADDYGLTINDDDTQAIFSDDLMCLSHVNAVDDKYTNENCPTYLMDNLLGTRSFAPTFRLNSFLTFLFEHYGYTPDISANILQGYDNDQLGVRIPVPFVSDTSDRNVVMNCVDTLGGFFSTIVATQVQPSLVNKYFNYSGSMTINDQLKLAYISQHRTRSEISYVGGMQGVDMHVHTFAQYQLVGGGGAIEEHSVLCPIKYTGTDSGIRVVSGDMYQAIRVLNYETEIGIFKFDDGISGAGCFYNNVNSIAIQEALKYKSQIGDAITFETGYYFDDLVLTMPTGYYIDTDEYFGSQHVDTKSGFVSGTNIQQITADAPIQLAVFDEAGSGMEIDSQTNNMQYIDNPPRVFSSGTNQMSIAPEFDLDVSRWGDDVILKECYNERDLTVYDVVGDILERYNLNIKFIDETFRIRTEDSFYNNDVMVVDHKVSEGIQTVKEYSNWSSITLSNKTYGNINDLDGEKCIYDLIEHDTGHDSGEPFSFSFQSTLQSPDVFGKTDFNPDVEFLLLDNDTKLWNFANAVKINTEDMPTTHGVIGYNARNDFRFPRAVQATAENFPNNEGSYLTEIENDVVIEHTLFNNAGHLWTIDGTPLSMVSDNNLVENRRMSKNFSSYIHRLMSDSVNIECETYVTNEEIMRIRDGGRIQLFGVIFKPINISEIRFENDSSLVTIKMTKEVEAPEFSGTFDSTVTTFDNTILTFDKTN